MKHVLFFISAFILQTTIIAQSVQISTIVAPPYSPYLSAYVNSTNKIQVLVVNISNSPQSIRFTFSMTGDNGISFMTDQNYKPSQPLILQPGQQKIFNSSNTELRNYFSTQNLKFIGIDKNSLVQSDVIPEGNYSICLQALDYQSGAPLSLDPPSGCALISISYVDPPIVIQPICNEDVKPTNPQIMIFSWVPPTTSPAGLDYIFTLKEMPISIQSGQSKSNQINPNDVINKTAFPVLYSTTLKSNTLVYNASMPKLLEGKSYVWRVQAKAINNQTNFKQNGYTEACLFHYQSEIKNIETNNPIKLNLPRDNFKITWNENEPNMPPHYLFSWENVRNSKYAYEVQIVEVMGGQTPISAFERNQLAVYDEKGAKYKTPYYLQNILKPGNYAWKVVYMDLDHLQNKPESDIWTFSVPEPPKADFNSFQICNKDIIPTKITNPDLENFSGEGWFSYKQNEKDPGIKQTVYFKDIKLKHTSKDAKGNLTDFKCYKGIVSGDLKFVKYALDPQDGLEGDFKYKETYIRMKADIIPQYDATTDVYKVEEGDKSAGYKTEIDGELIWNSDLYYKTGSTYGGAPLPQTNDCNQNPQLCGVNVLTMKFPVKNNVSEFGYDLNLNLKDPDAFLTIFKDSKFTVIGTKLTANFNGKFSISSGKMFMNIPLLLNYSFVSATNFLIKLDQSENLLKKIPWDKKGNVYTHLSQTETYLRLSDKKPSEQVTTSKKGLIIIPNIHVKNSSSKELIFSVPYMLNEGKGFTISKMIPFEGMTLYKFNATPEIYKVNIVNSNLSILEIKGNMEVPFVNLKVPFAITAGYDKKPVTSLIFKNEKTVVFNNGKQLVTMTPFGGSLINDEEVMLNGSFKFENNSTNEDPSFTANQVYLEGIIVKYDNTIRMDGMVKNFQWQKTAQYNGFDYKLSSYRLYSKDGKNIFKFWGDIVLEENTIAPQEKMQLEFAYSPSPYPLKPLGYYNLSASTEKFIASPPPNDVSIQSNGFKAGYCNAGICFDATFKYMNDQVYGKGFFAEANADLKEPMQAKIHTKIMAGKTPSGYKYWFLEASQQELINVETGILDIVIYGFEGRIYYHMNHAEGGNIDKSNYVPSKEVGYGIFALSNIKTSGSEGRVLWGTVSTELQTTSSGGILPIRLRGEAFILSEGAGQAGTEKVHGTADLTLNVMSPRYLAGLITVEANAYDLIKAQGDITLQMGDGKWYLHMGTPQNMVKVSVPALGNKSMNGYLTIDREDGQAKLGLGVDGELYSFDVTKKKCYGCCFIAGAHVKLHGQLHASAKLPAFQFGGAISLNATASVSASACGVGAAPSVSAIFNGAFELPSPFCIAGGLKLVTPDPLPNFNIKVRYKDGAISGANHCQ